MKYPAALFIVFMACTPPQNTAQNTSQESGVAERPLTQVKVNVTQTRTYCGGAKPSQEVLNDLQTPRPLAGKKVYLRAGKINDIHQAILDSATTDNDGVFYMRIPKGDYVIIFEDKTNSDQYNEWWKTYRDGNANYDPIDKRCLDEWLAAPEMAISITEEKPVEYDLTVREPCEWQKIPCAEYKGPKPQ